MRKIWLLSTCLLAACTMQQKDGEFQGKPAPLFGGDQSWHISEQKKFSPRAGFCTISAADIDASLRFGDRGDIQPYVSSSRELTPGMHYKILVGGHYYETTSGHFSNDDSRAIFADFKQAKVAYTELVDPSVSPNRGRSLRRYTNKISLAGFNEAYRGCVGYLGATQKPAKLKKKH